MAVGFSRALFGVVYRARFPAPGAGKGGSGDARVGGGVDDPAKREETSAPRVALPPPAPTGGWRIMIARVINR